MTNSLTPSPELVTSLRNSAPHGIRDAGVTRELWLINSAYAAGADQELEACCEWLVNKLTFREDGIRFAGELRSAMRPKPPSLKEKALTQLTQLVVDLDRAGMRQRASILEGPIRRALEALPND